MKSVIFISLLLALAAPGEDLQSREKVKLSPKEMLDQVDDLYRGTSSHGILSMNVVTEHWSREMKIEFWSKGKEKSLMRILAPKKEKGTSTLKSGVNIWNFLPKVKRVIKVPSSMMGTAWMGSHFTNDDIVKESRMAEDFDLETTFEGKRDGVEVVEITCTPKPDAAVVWGKLLVLVRVSDLQPLWIRYFDQDLELVRTMVFSDFNKMTGKLLPALIRIVPTDKPKEFTEVRYQKIEFDKKIKSSLFSLRNLQR